MCDGVVDCESGEDEDPNNCDALNESERIPTSHKRNPRKLNFHGRTDTSSNDTGGK